MHALDLFFVAALPALVAGAQTINRLKGQGLTFGRMDPVV